MLQTLPKCFLDASTHLYKRVCPSVRPSVRPERVFFNEPITGENGRKWLGKQCKCSQLVRMSSELSLNVPKCLKMSQNVKKCRKMSEPIMGENGRKWLGKQCKCSKLVRKSSQLSQNVSKCPLPTHRCPNGLVESSLCILWDIYYLRLLHRGILSFILTWLKSSKLSDKPFGPCDILSSKQFLVSWAQKMNCSRALVSN